MHYPKFNQVSSLPGSLRPNAFDLHPHFYPTVARRLTSHHPLLDPDVLCLAVDINKAARYSN